MDPHVAGLFDEFQSNWGVTPHQLLNIEFRTEWVQGALAASPFPHPPDSTDIPPLTFSPTASTVSPAKPVVPAAVVIPLTTDAVGVEKKGMNGTRKGKKRQASGSKRPGAAGKKRRAAKMDATSDDDEDQEEEEEEEEEPGATPFVSSAAFPANTRRRLVVDDPPPPPHHRGGDLPSLHRQMMMSSERTMTLPPLHTISDMRGRSDDDVMEGAEGSADRSEDSGEGSGAGRRAPIGMPWLTEEK